MTRFLNTTLISNLRGLSLAMIFVLSAAGVYAQTAVRQVTQVHDATALRPPAGARVAIVEFADMQCPDCAAHNPLLKEAAAKYHIPWVRHDFPLPYHNWSTNAAVNARWFDQKNQALGDAYRDEVYANQRSITTPAELTVFTQNFAKRNNITLPFAVDPQGKLTAMVRADFALGQRIGIEFTPTIWIVSANSNGAPFVELVDRTKLYQLIDQALANTKPATPVVRPRTHK